MRYWRLVGLAVAATTVVVPAAAPAATVEVERGSFTVGEGVYTAGPGEANRLTVAFEPGNLAFTVTDPGAVIVAGEHCRSIDAHAARCEAPELTFGPEPRPDFVRAFREMHVTLSDGDDRFTSGAGVDIQLDADGGPGNDVLEGGASRDSFDGGGGRDRLLGGDGEDELTDGDRSGAADGDHLDGGPGGADTVLYENRTAGVMIELTRGMAGEPGEDDTVLGIERASGGAGDDRIVGTNGDDWLHGNGGDDLIAALAGDDFVYAGDGEDRLHGGKGGDLLDGEDGVDAPRCGSGDDVVHNTTRDERLRWACDFVQVGSIHMDAHPLRVTRRAVWLDGRCPDDEGYGGFLNCKGTMKLHKAGGARRLLARGTFSLDAARPVKLRLTKRGRRLVNRRRGVVANVSYRAEEASSSYDNFTGHADWAVRVRRNR